MRQQSIARAVLAAGVLCLIALSSSAQAAESYGVQMATVTFVVTHKLHKVDGSSNQVTATVQWDGGSFRLMAQAASKSFSSGNANRDQHMLEVIEAARYPAVIVRGIGKLAALPAPGQTVTTTARTEVDLHGSKIVVEMALTIRGVDAQHLQVDFSFADSLTAHNIERPALLFVPVDDVLPVHGTLTLVKQ